VVRPFILRGWDAEIVLLHSKLLWLSEFTADVKQGAKKPAKESSANVTVKSVPSPTRVQGQRGGRPELPPRTPARRVPFANLQASALNVRSPQGHSLRKATTLPEKLTPSKVVAVLEERMPSSTTQEVIHSSLQLALAANANDQAGRFDSFESIR